jgi:hypothetical protein
VKDAPALVKSARRSGRAAAAERCALAGPIRAFASAMLPILLLLAITPPSHTLVPAASQRLSFCIDGNDYGMRMARVSIRRPVLLDVAPTYTPQKAHVFVLVAWTNQGHLQKWSRGELAFMRTTFVDGESIDEFGSAWGAELDVDHPWDDGARDPRFGAAFGLEVHGETYWFQGPDQNAPITPCYAE